jgi:hypothetical protein
MRKETVRSLLAMALAVAAGAIQAQPTAHYVPGVEGIDAATLPPPGFYMRDYNVFYYSDALDNGQGRNLHVPGFQAYTYANVPRAIWITDTKFLGGYVGVDGLLPIEYQSLKVGPVNNNTFGIGDFFAESTLSWHLKQLDLSAGLGLWMPTGDSSSSPTSTRAGLGYWTPMLTLGGTWYIDPDKTWAVSALDRYEFNSEDRDSHDTRGQAETLEWGVSKKFWKRVDFGVVGYYQQKTTADTGSYAPWKKLDDGVVAIGPEVNVVFPKLMLFASLRYEYEVLADNRAQGQTVTLTLTKRF